MGVGPARFGLRPGVGKRPGHDPTRDSNSPRRTIQYPGNDANHYPGRSLFIYAETREARYPSNTLYPANNLRPGGEILSRTRTSLLSASGRFLLRPLRGRRRTTMLAGAGRLLGSPLPSSAPRTTMSEVVELSSVDLVVELALIEEAVELELVDKVVDL